MQKESPSIQKVEWRKRFDATRRSISEERRKMASSLLEESLERVPTLSFASCGAEIELSAFNHQLAAAGLLFLPRIEQNELALYRVASLSSLRPAPFYSLLEPDPRLCPAASLAEVEQILVPGLAFDRKRYRLGYGKGLYDHLLKNARAKSIGVGFKEQLSEELIPRDSWDVAVDQLSLF